MTAWDYWISKSFWAAPSSGICLQHIYGLCRAHCSRPSGATACMDCQWFSLSKASQLVQRCEDRLSATDSAQLGDWLFPMVGRRRYSPVYHSKNGRLRFNSCNITSKQGVYFTDQLLMRLMRELLALWLLKWYTVRIRTQLGIYGQIYRFAFKSSLMHCPRELLQAKGIFDHISLLLS